MQIDETSTKLPAKIVVNSAEIPRTRKHRKKNWQCTFEGCTDPLKTRYNCYSHIWDTHLRKVLCEKDPGRYEDVPYKNIQNKELVKSLCEKYMTQLVSDKKRQESDDEQLVQQISSNPQPIQHIPQLVPVLSQIQPQSQIQPILQNQIPSQLTQPIQPQLSQIVLAQPPNVINSFVPSYPLVPNQMLPYQYQMDTTPQITSFDQTLSSAEQTNSQEVKIEMQQLQSPQQSNALSLASNEWDVLINTVNVSQSATHQLLCSELQKGDFLRIYNISKTLHRLHVYGEVLAENGYFVRSDERTKCHIRPLSDCLESISQLVGKQYRYKNSPQLRLGFVAQEVKEVLPDLVHTDEITGTLSVDVLGVIPFLVESLKQLNSEITMLDGANDTQFKCLQDRVVEALNLADDLKIKQKQDLYELQKCIDKAQEPMYSFSFGPIPVTLYFASILTFMSLILPFTYCYQYIMWGYFIFTTLCVYFSLILERKELCEMFRFHRVVWEWKTYHFITLSLFTFLFILSLSFTVIMGSASFQTAAGITVVVLLIIIILIFLHKIINLSFCVVSTILCAFLVIGFISIGIIYVIQPSYQPEILNYQSGQTFVLDSNNQFKFSINSPPFNCFSPNFYSKNLGSLSLIQNSLSDNEFIIQGNLSETINDVQFYLTCSKYLTFYFGSYSISHL
ncbi:hypothetical protein ENUP19_0307G0004 [Entamoeba nuttalli]|uniref:Peptidase S74 domain-containing protein n=2 Tax=Entamoeba nuttalli TaxID=412467 RepID=K2HPG2_ENTNP|nr:hypothetical protein ENU1_187140 [Entamoeba nuttalli P19]EKE37765.1 hypothetical protein ENU1_187140 [Entamoeba nuttalli P19]|eukprot:XP_008859899.1 hypothetical protein ENU1_187140 [Entamoeba nuttalli P19]